MLTEGSAFPMVVKSRPVGIASSTSRVSTSSRVELTKSTIGESPVTVMDCSTPATSMSAFTGATKFVVSTIPSRRIVLNPASVKTTV